MGDLNEFIRIWRWRKRIEHGREIYVDTFELLEPDFRQLVDDRINDAQNQERQKSDNVSAIVQTFGARAVQKRKWVEATELYNEAVCAAENGSTTLCRAYEARSKCFAHRGMVEEARIDMDLSRSLPMTSAHTIDIPSNGQFLNLDSALEVRQNSTFGRHIVAKCDIPVGQIITMDRPFAGVVYKTNESDSSEAYCLTCYRTNTNFIPCPNCTDVMFCSRSCQQNNDIHPLECQSLFHRIDGTNLKLPVQMVLLAVKHFPDVRDLIAFVETIRNEPSADINGLQNVSFPEYGLIMKLKCSPTYNDLKRAYKAFQIMMRTMPTIQRYFNSIDSQRFLAHLLIHHIGTIRSNGWSDTLGLAATLQFKYIHHTISLLNHSCAPNTHYEYHRNTVGQLVTVRPIKRGDQIFINYLGDDVQLSTEGRRRCLEDGWQFRCECERCGVQLASQIEQTEHERNRMLADPDFQYYQSHRRDVHLPAGDERRNRLKDICAQIIENHGHIWSQELNNVTDVFVKISLN